MPPLCRTDVGARRNPKDSSAVPKNNTGKGDYRVLSRHTSTILITAFSRRQRGFESRTALFRYDSTSPPQVTPQVSNRDVGVGACGCADWVDRMCGGTGPLTGPSPVHVDRQAQHRHRPRAEVRDHHPAVAAVGDRAAQPTCRAGEADDQQYAWRAGHIAARVSGIAGFLERLRKSAEQLDPLQRWYRILSEALRHFLHARQLQPPLRLNSASA